MFFIYFPYKNPGTQSPDHVGNTDFGTHRNMLQTGVSGADNLIQCSSQKGGKLKPIIGWLEGW